MGGGEKSRLSQSEQARARAEKLAARAEQRKTAVVAAKESHRIAPEWLRSTVVSFQDRATLLGDNDPMIERCRFHEERLATIIHKIDGEVLPAGCADGLRDDLEYLLELLADPEANIEALEAMHDRALYEELRTTVPAEVPPASGAAEDLTDTAENAPVLLMIQLDFAESVEEIRQALLAAMPLLHTLDPQDTIPLRLAADAARERLKRVKAAQQAEARIADAARAEQRARVSVSADAAMSASRSVNVNVNVNVKPARDGAQDGAEEASQVGDGRIVLNHSTHCEGLQIVLRRLCKGHLVKTCVPGRLHQVASHVPAFEMRVQRVAAATASSESESGGSGADVTLTERVKCVARNGRTAQDVELILKPQLMVSLVELEEAIEHAIRPPREAEASSYDKLPDGGGRLNLSSAEIAEQRQQVLHSKLKAEHERQRATQRGREREQLEREKERKLASSAAARERGLSIKDHAKQWAAVEAGDLSSGKYWGGGRSKREVGSFD
ncbi:metal-binding protein [Chrysochromulina tobinii]|uniref:Metal-binding protein n=1 Tax=Chrysochromulina tobinii TaxID=1460289 RepID=A0A0M0JLP5_9EUKA|nr:metal-binding protein [Chrysochromulina tobinii]|eukprot:KOO27481.1 metal-binding protein [Chrysochromulina sp. CCMP291]